MSGSTIARAVADQKERPSLVQVVQRMQPEIQRALPKGMDADRMARLALTVIRQTPGLANCTAESFAGALLTAAALGLEPGVNGEAYLVPFGDECTLIVGFQGYAKLFWQHPLAKHLDAQAVHEHDDFDYAYGIEPYLRHRPARGDRGEVIYYYAVASLTTGASVFEVMSPTEVAAVRASALKRRKGPQIDDPQHWMQRKTLIRQLVKRLPRSTALAQAIAADEQTGTELAAQKVPEAISAGDPPGIPADVDPVTGEVDTAYTSGSAPYDPAAEPAGWTEPAEVKP